MWEHRPEHRHHHDHERNPIQLIVDGQLLRIATPIVVAGTHNYLELLASFRGEQWQGTQKWVTFDMGTDAHYVLPLHDDQIKEEDRLDLTAGTWEVSVYGYVYNGDGDVISQRITTNRVLLFVERSDGIPFPPLTPTEAEMLANEVEYARSLAEEVKQKADEGEFDGATFLPDVSEEGIISWTNDKEKENPEPRNIKGPKGDTGPDTVYIGETEPEGDWWKVWIQPTGEGSFAIESFELVSGSHLPGTTDLYRATMTNGDVIDIPVYNGADGSGHGDMVASVYDPDSKRTDIFEYVDEAVEENGKGVFWAEYGETTYTQIKAAFQAGKNVLMLYEQEYIFSLYKIDDEDAMFNRKSIVSSGTERFLNYEYCFVSSTFVNIWSEITSYYIPAFGNFANVAFSGSYSDLLNKPALKPVATSGDYEDLTGKPVLDNAVTAQSPNAPTSAAVAAYVAEHSGSQITVDSAMSGSSTNPVQNKVVKQYIDGLQLGDDVFATGKTNSITIQNSGEEITEGYKTITISIPLQGYTPMGIIGVYFTDSRIITTDEEFISLKSFYVQDVNTAKVSFHYKFHIDSEVTVTATATVLYVKN